MLGGAPEIEFKMAPSHVQAKNLPKKPLPLHQSQPTVTTRSQMDFHGCRMQWEADLWLLCRRHGGFATGVF